EAVGWRVLELKYGRRLREAFARGGGSVLRGRIDEMPNEQYQSLFAASDEVISETLQDGLSGGDRAQLVDLLRGYRAGLRELVSDLGGHDLGDILDALAVARRDASRPTVIFAYTIKGYGLEIAGRPLNHSAQLSGEQIDRLRAAGGLDSANEWDRFPE